MASRLLNRERCGWIFYDWANSAYVLCVVTVLGSAYFVAIFDDAAQQSGSLRHGGLPALAWGGLYFTAEAAWSFIIASAALLVVLSAPLLGALADGRGSKKLLLGLYCMLGVAATLGLGWPLPWWGVGVLILLGTIGYEGGNVFYNAFLPEIAPPEARNRLSGAGYAAGYLGGVLVLIAALLFFVPPRGEVRFSFVLVGLWWGGFALFPLAWLRERPPPRPLRKGALRQGWRDLRDNLRGIARYPQAFRFLIAFLLYNDGIATLISNTTPFALQHIYLDASHQQKIGLAQLIPAVIMIQFLAIPGSLICSWLADRWGEKRAILLTLLVFIFVLSYGQVIQLLTEFYAMAALIGLVLGGAQAVSRSLFASLIPSGKYAGFFAFFAFSARFSAFAGPLIYGVLVLSTGSARVAILSLSLFFVAGAALLFTVDVSRGRQAALHS